jgi:hypothetical protein
MNFVETILASQHGRGGGAPRFFPPMKRWNRSS